MKYQESIPLPNGCLFVIGTVELLVVPDDALNELGQLDLSSYACAGVSGLNTYYSLEKKALNHSKYLLFIIQQRILS